MRKRIPRWLNPLYWLRLSGQFAQKWFLTMPRSTIGTALPSLIAGLALLAITGLSLVRESDWREQRIRQGLYDALRRSDHAEVELLCRRLLRQDPSDKTTLQFQLAAALSHGEQKETAGETMRRLALDSRHPPAAIWLLNDQFLPVEWKDWDADKRGQFGSLMEVAVSEKGADPKLVSLYADYLISQDEAEKALPYLETLIDAQPVRALQAAIIYRQNGNENRAASTARRGLRQLEKLGVEEPTNVGLYLAQQRFLLFQRRYEDAARLLKRGLDITEDDRLREAAAETMVVWSHDPPEKKNETVRLAQQMSLMRQAVHLAPHNAMVLQSLVPLVLESTTENSPKVAQMRKLLVNGVSPDLSHFIRGTAAMIKGDVDEATFHLELAAERMPEVPSVLNNLAVTLASREDADLEKSLHLVDAALAQKPNHPHFHETRGQILIKLERYQDAIVALEQALPAKQLALPIHRSLAIAYRELGKEEIAGEHERIAKGE